MRLKAIVATLIGLIGPLSLSCAQDIRNRPSGSIGSQAHFVPTGWASAAVNNDLVSFVHGDSYITRVQWPV
jgi:hypothetical protein